MKITSRQFLRDFTRIKAAAKAGEAIFVKSGEDEFVLRLVSNRTWQGALKGKARIVGDLFSTGSGWETSAH